MQYQVDPTDQTQENGQKPRFLLFWSFKNIFLWFLNDPSWPSRVGTCCRIFSTTTICKIKSIRQTKLEKMAKNLLFGSLDHSKMHFCDSWTTLHDLVVLAHVEYLVLPQCAISSQSDRPSSRKWPKTTFLALRIIQKSIFCDFWMIQHDAYHGQIVKTI